MTTASRERVMAIAAEIRGFLSARADEGLAARNARYFKEGYDAYGIDQKTLEAQVKAWANNYGAELGLVGALELGDLLFSSGKYEEGGVAMLLVASFRKQLNREACQRLGQWLDGGVRNWAHCDVLCGELLARCLREGRMPVGDLEPWRASPFKYKRRAVPVAMLGLLKDRPDCTPLLDLLRPMMMDGERVVQQGLGWFLREAWKTEPEAVESFLLEWKDTAPRLIFQYATEKMSAEGKARFRRERAGKGVANDALRSPKG
jgi:3-methyladenine DNA glycosylase AlkD